MKILKKILIVIVIIIAIPLIIALFVPKEYSVERDIVINKPKQEVFNYVKHLKNQDEYSVWVRKDPNMKKSFKGEDGTVGFVYGWDGNNDVGQGEQEIKNITEGEKIDLQLRFKKPMEGQAEAPITTERISDNETKVKWGFNGKSNYPFNFMNLFMDGMLGKDIQESLGNLKRTLEK